VGERHLKLLLQPLNGEGQIDAIAFNTAELPGSCREVRAAYQLDVNEYRGMLSAQLVVEYIEAT
jgi:single-stranded-DNA-specific exonuclease